MVKTFVEKVTSPKPDVTIFKISGTLGFHENEVMTRFFSECRRKGITKLVMDFSSLSSLGGGCAKIIREQAGEGYICVCIAGASQFVRKYLDDGGNVVFTTDIARAIDLVDEVMTPTKPEQMDQLDAGIDEILEDVPAVERQPTRTPVPPTQRTAPTPSAPARPVKRPQPPPPVEPEQPAPVVPAEPVKPAAPMPSPGRATELDPERPRPPAPIPEVQPSAPTEPAPAAASNGGNGADAPLVLEAKDTSTDVATNVASEPVPRAAAAKPGEESDAKARDLHRKLIQYRSLLSLSSDFNRIRDKGKLLDAFLLTTIAQVGVESAAFLEFRINEFCPVCWKGFETADPSSLNLSLDDVDLDLWRKDLKITSLEDAPIADEAKNRLASWGMPYIAPFVVHENFRGLVMLGRPIRAEFDKSSWDYLGILINQAAVAYENTHRFEEESERALGLVQTMISMIEENTITRGSTDQVMNYTYATAQRMHYSPEFMRDLMYGAVLRYIGMIKISDLIVRSPRELVEEEWEIIKRHPVDGADMLAKMNFSEHTTQIVLHHHERFNGEGYPNGLNGPHIPLGARIVSVVESYVAMIQDRPTRSALAPEEALNTLKENWGIRYDPDVIKEFTVVVEEEIRTGEAVNVPGNEILSL